MLFFSPDTQKLDELYILINQEGGQNLNYFFSSTFF